MRILFIFPNIDCGGIKPVGLTSVMNSCRAAGHEVRLFDTSFFDIRYIIQNDRYLGINEAGEEVLNYRHVDVSGYGLVKEKKNVEQELCSVLREFKPQVVGISALSMEWKLAVHLFRSTKSFDNSIYTILGGIHAYADPEGAIAEDSVDMVCIGEGENCLIDLLERVESRVDYEKTNGFWVKKDGKLYKNSIGQLVHNLNKLPYLDYDFYDDRLMLRVYDGSVYRSGDQVITRGCYGKCLYCLFNTMQQINSDNSKLRRYDLDRIISELVYLKKRYRLNFFRFQDSTFLSLNQPYLRELAKRYSKEVHLPFVIDVSPQTVCEEKVRALVDMGCVAVGVGVETGNEKMRFEMCNKPVKDKTILKAFDTLNYYGLRTVSFLMMGFPMETIDMYWDTVRIVREAKVQAPTLGFVYPFKGTRLRELSLKLNLFDEDAEEKGEIGYSRSWPAIKNPNISIDEYRGLLRAFLLYVKFPERYWKEIKKTEKFTEEGDMVYQKFSKIYKAEGLYNSFFPEENMIQA